VAAAPSEHLELGYVSRAHGLKGELEIRPFDAASETLFAVKRVLLRLKDGSEKAFSVLSAHESTKGVMVVFRGVRSREQATELVGSTVLVFREDLEAPAEGEYFQGDLVGLAAFNEAGAPLGTVEEIWDTGPVPNLVIRSSEGGELLVPFVEEFVPAIDMEKRTVTIRPLELLE
jgi:16S rRNA processing protein RimM